MGKSNFLSLQRLRILNQQQQHKGIGTNIAMGKRYELNQTGIRTVTTTNPKIN